MRNGNAEHRAVKVEFSTDAIILTLADGRRVESPLQLYPSLADAPPKARDHHRLVGNGLYINWPDLDLDLETEQIVLGEPEKFPAPPLRLIKRSKHGSSSFHVRYSRKQKSWGVFVQEKPFATPFQTKEIAQAEALSLSRMLGLADVYIHGKTGRLERVVSIERKPKREHVTK